MGPLRTLRRPQWPSRFAPDRLNPITLVFGPMRARPESRQGEPKMAVFENRSGAYFVYVSSGSAKNRHLQAAMATFGPGSQRDGASMAATVRRVKTRIAEVKLPSPHMVATSEQTASVLECQVSAIRSRAFQKSGSSLMVVLRP